MKNKFSKTEENRDIKPMKEENKKGESDGE